MMKPECGAYAPDVAQSSTRFPSGWAGLLFLLALGLTATNAIGPRAAETNPLESPADEMELVMEEGEWSRDVGHIVHGGTRKTALHIRNAGQRPVRLTHIKRSCASCSLTPERAVFLPGKTTTFTLTVKAAPQYGKHSRTFFLGLRDDRSSCTQPLTVHWSVPAFVCADPPVLEFAPKRYDQAWATTLTLRAAGLPCPLAVRTIAPSSPHLMASVTPTQAGLPGHEDNSLQVSVRLLTAALAGPFRETLRIGTNCAEQPEIVVPVEGIIEGPFTMGVAYLNFGLVPHGARSEKRVTIWAAPGERHCLLSARSSIPAFTCSLRGPCETGQWSAVVAIDASTPCGSYRGTIDISSDCANQKCLSLPVLAVIR